MNKQNISRSSAIASREALIPRLKTKRVSVTPIATHVLIDVLLCTAIFVAVGLSALAYYPGVYTNDSAGQLAQALTGKYGDWHPPAMAYVWSALIAVTGRIESLFVSHYLLLGIGTCLWVRALRGLRIASASFLLPLLILSPVISGFSGVVWKDVGFAFAMLTAAALAALRYLHLVGRGSVIGVIALTMYAVGVRPNGVLAVLPLIYLLGWTELERFQMISWKVKTGCLAVSLVVVAAIVGVPNLWFTAITKVERQYPFQYTQLYDLAGIFSLTEHNYLPEYVLQSPGYNREAIRSEYLKSISTFGNANNLVFLREGNAPSYIPLTTNPAFIQKLQSAWVSATVNHPLSYLSHRVEVVKWLMGRGFYPRERPQRDNDRLEVLRNNGVDLGSIALGSTIGGGLDRVRFLFDKAGAFTEGTFLVKGWFWFSSLVVSVLISLLCAQKVRVVTTMLCISSILYILPYTVVVGASDFRYLYWSVIAACLSVLLVLSDLLRRAGAYLLHDTVSAPEGVGEVIASRVGNGF